MSDPTQSNRQISLSTPLGEDVLLLKSFDYQDELCRPFRMEMELQSTQDDINFDDIVGQKVTVTINLPNYQKRYINGYIAQFRQVGFTASSEQNLTDYRAVMVPWLWMLSRSSNCRIFQNKTPLDIIKSVWNGSAYTSISPAISDVTTASYPTLDFCVQYDESDLNFVTRLMEKYGIYYYFEHTQSEATMILCDSMTAHADYPGYSSVPYNAEKPDSSLPEHIYEWMIEQDVEPGSFKISDYNYTSPKTDLTSTGTQTQSYSNGSYERYSYPGGYLTTDEGQDLADVRIQDVQARQAIQRGVADTLGIVTGYTFSMTSYPRSDQNTEYLTTKTDLVVTSPDFSTLSSADTACSCACRFQVIATTRSFRPACVTPRPRIRGPQTATVVGTSGKEVDADEYGSVIVQFHWDQEGSDDENSSCRIRVSEFWSGSGWGATFLPHIGSEVIVSFEDGNPDYPLVTGRVYNADQMPYKDPETNPYLGYFIDSSKKNSLVMDATSDAEKLTITNNENQIEMDNTSGSEKMTLTDGKSTIVFDPTAGSVTTTTPGDESNSNDGDKSHWTTGSWDEWVGGIKNSIVIGLYLKLYQGCEFGVTTGAKVSIVLGPELKLNTAGVAGIPFLSFANCAKFEIYKGDCYKLLFGTEYKLESKQLKKLNAVDELSLWDQMKAIYTVKETIAAVKVQETTASKTETCGAYTCTYASETRNITGISSETVGGMKNMTYTSGLSITIGTNTVTIVPAAFNMNAAGPMGLAAPMLNLN